MRYDYLKDSVNAYLDRYGIVTESDEFEFRRWLALTRASESLMQKGYWTWKIGMSEETCSSNIVELPWIARTYPIYVTKEDITSEPFQGRTLNAQVFLYNKINATDYDDGMWVPYGETTSADYTYTYASIDSDKTTITVDEEITSAVATALVGKSLRVANEPSFYVISSASAAAAGSATITIDRAYTKPGTDTQSPETDATIEVEPPGARKIRLYEDRSSVYCVYHERYRPPVNDTDDCGWDSRLDTFMPLLVAGYITLFSGDSQRGGAMIGTATDGVMNALQEDVDGVGTTAKRFQDPDSGLGRRRSLTIGGLSQRSRNTRCRFKGWS